MFFLDGRFRLHYAEDKGNKTGSFFREEGAI